MVLAHAKLARTMIGHCSAIRLMIMSLVLIGFDYVHAFYLYNISIIF